MRVPASIVVRMNSASNMIAKWYQYFHSHSIECSAPADSRAAARSKISAIPTASVTAPPVRPRSDSCVRRS